MTDLSKIASQLRGAVKELREKIAAVDEKISALDAQRDALTNGIVSKADFLEYVRAMFKRKASTFQREIISALKGTREFGALEHFAGIKNDFVNVFFFKSGPAPVVITEEALCFYFGEIMVERLGAALGSLDWPQNAVPVELRRTQLENVKVEKEELLRQRGELVAMLNQAGVAC